MIPDDRVGIELTEPNQLVGLNRHYKHIIFIGTDINHFPPASVDNFLYTYEEDIKYFGANNYFTSSKTQLDELKRLSANLYIVTASHSGKRELSRSILIGNKFDGSIDISDIYSVNEMALNQQIVTPTDTLQEYYDSITGSDFTKYDGAGVENIKVTHLSASQINKYIACPLAYLYSNKVKLQVPKSLEEGFDAMDQGSLMHLCFELFGRAIKENKISSTDEEKLYELMFKKSIEVFEHNDTQEKIGELNIHHEIFLSNLQAGLKDDRKKGLLAKFVDYYIAHAKEFDYFQNSEFEKEFALDNDLKPYTLSDKEDKNYFIKGFIDRFDNLKDHINIIDYKSKKMSSNIDKDKQEQLETLKDVQLALYILYASQQHPDKEYIAHLLSFKGDNPYYHFANLSTIEDLKDTVHFSEEYNNNLKKLIYDIKDNIEAGQFAFNNADEKACEYCEYKFICHESVLSKYIMENNR
ncbi:MAG: PD-(D/E)XK nuclease family protein [Epsilonproteobacteria bacterium]|nr:PD-(D/E)XK nuclease family protein [Campylobacterota bacterium]